MSLIKKTFVLTDKTPKGYVTLVRVGNESGAKIVGETFKQGMKAYLKIGRQSQTVILLGKRTEAELNIELSSSDAVSCLIVSDGEIIASGGKELSEREKSVIVGKIAEKTDGETATAKSDENTAVAAINAENSDENGGTQENNENENGAAQEQADETENGETEKAETDGTEKAEEGNDPEDGAGRAETENDGQSAEENGQGEVKSAEEDMLGRLKEEKSGYYLGISDKIDELFVVYPNERLLEEAIPDSEWVKVNYDGDDYYVVGKLKDDGKVRYLGYGVPGREDVKPPKAADGIASWFPLANLDGYDGYWLFFQDAETGRIDG